MTHLPRSVGLVQNHIEGAGVATVSMTVRPHITGSVGAPRAVFLRYPAGNQAGEAGKPIQQRMILQAALEAAYHIKEPGTIVELPYRWRRFPIDETPVFSGDSHGARRPLAEAMGADLDALARRSREYGDWLASRLAEAEANLNVPRGLANAFRQQLQRVYRLIETLDTRVLDEYRETVNSIATLELRAAGKFV